MDRYPTPSPSRSAPRLHQPTSSLRVCGGGRTVDRSPVARKVPKGRRVLDPVWPGQGEPSTRQAPSEDDVGDGVSRLASFAVHPSARRSEEGGGGGDGPPKPAQMTQRARESQGISTGVPLCTTTLPRAPSSTFLRPERRRVGERDGHGVGLGFENSTDQLVRRHRQPSHLIVSTSRLEERREPTSCPVDRTPRSPTPRSTRHSTPPSPPPWQPPPPPRSLAQHPPPPPLRA